MTGEEDDPPRPVLSPLFWACLIAALICIAAGLAVDVYGPRLFPPRGSSLRPSSTHALGKPAPRR